MTWTDEDEGEQCDICKYWSIYSHEEPCCSCAYGEESNWEYVDD